MFWYDGGICPHRTKKHANILGSWSSSSIFPKRPLTTSVLNKEQQGLGNLEPTCWVQVEVYILRYIDVRSIAADPEGSDPVVRITKYIVFRGS